MSILAIDPGPERSAWVLYDGTVLACAHEMNGEVLLRLRYEPPYGMTVSGTPLLAVEMVASFGMPVGREVFETVLWIGRFVEAWGGAHELVYRKDVKLYLCGNTRAKDPHIRQALIDRFGPGKARAVGTKRAPGPLYGVHGDVWSALAVAVTAEAQVGVGAGAGGGSDVAG